MSTHPTSRSSGHENRDGGKPTHTLSGFPGAVCNLKKAFNVKLQVRVGARRSKTVCPSRSLKGSPATCTAFTPPRHSPTLLPRERRERGWKPPVLCRHSRKKVSRVSEASRRSLQGWLGFKEGKEPLKVVLPAPAPAPTRKVKGEPRYGESQGTISSALDAQMVRRARNPEVKGRFPQVEDLLAPTGGSSCWTPFTQAFLVLPEVYAPCFLVPYCHGCLDSILSA